jgi:hypothetical protein
MAQDLIRFDLLVQEALKGVVRKVLIEAAENGLPGEHHFFISFRTHASGVRISPRLMQRHPEEMTIVLQHQFWDLTVTDTTFEVGLSFNGIPERLLVPFDALSGFWDPSVDFGLKFELASIETADNDVTETPEDLDAALERTLQESVTHTEVPKEPAAVETEADDGDAKVVSLSAFRKKP